MIEKIAEHGRTIVLTLPFADHVGGLVRSVESTQDGKDITYPSYCPDNDCTDHRYTPNETKNSVIYFEQLGPARAVQRTQKRTDMECDLKCVLWLNNKKMGYTDCSISHLIVPPLIKAMETANPINDRPIAGLRFRFITELEKGPALFSNYTYEDKRNYWLRPFDTAGLVFRATWSIPDDCIDDFTLNPEVC